MNIRRVLAIVTVAAGLSLANAAIASVVASDDNLQYGPFTQSIALIVDADVSALELTQSVSAFYKATESRDFSSVAQCYAVTTKLDTLKREDSDIIDVRVHSSLTCAPKASGDVIDLEALYKRLDEIATENGLKLILPSVVVRTGAVIGGNG